MAHDRDSQAGTVLLAFIVGAIAGAAVALLWAPAAGAETRRKLGDALGEGSEKGREYLKQRREQFAAAVEKGVEKGKDAIDRGKDAIEKGKEAFEQARAGSKEKA
jgi:gas vesicle protein